MKFPQIEKKSWFYKNCKQQRKRRAKICQICPFRKGIELQEKGENMSKIYISISGGVLQGV
jgi:hypothetical protein